MPRLKLTAKFISTLKPGAKDCLYWDTELRGFGAKMTANGHLSYFAFYRNPHGRQHRITLATGNRLACDQARAMARQLLAGTAMGQDPAKEKRARKQASSVAELCERYLSEHSRIRKKPTSIKDDEYLISTVVKPHFGNRPIMDITRSDIAAMMTKLHKNPYKANRARAVLSKMFNLAEMWGLRLDGSNPCRHVPKFPEYKRARFYSFEELERIGAELARREAEGTEHPAAIAALRFLAFTGCRLTEGLGIQWQSVDFHSGVVRLADAKTGPRPIVLGQPAMDLLKAQPRTTKFVFPSKSGDCPMTMNYFEAFWRRIRTSAEIVDGRIHDFRHTVGTLGGHAGLNAFVIRDMLGHKGIAMTARYVEHYTAPIKIAADRVSAQILDAMNGDRCPPDRTENASPLTK